MTGGRWKDVPLGDLVDIYDGPHATPSKTRSGPVFLGISNLASGRLDLTQAEHLSEADYRRWTRRVTPAPNDIVFSYEKSARPVPAAKRWASRTTNSHSTTHWESTIAPCRSWVTTNCATSPGN